MYVVKDLATGEQVEVEALTPEQELAKAEGKLHVEEKVE